MPSVIRLYAIRVSLIHINIRPDQVDTSLQNLNLRTDLRWVSERIRKSARKFTQVVNRP